MELQAPSEAGMDEFDIWNNLKKKISNERASIFCLPGEVWWCFLGKNIGSEQNGKNHSFERPVLIIKTFNQDFCRIIPLTSRFRNDSNHVGIHYLEKDASAIMSQMKTVSTKRLSRKITILDDTQFQKVLEKTIDSLYDRSPSLS